MEVEGEQLAIGPAKPLLQALPDFLPPETAFFTTRQDGVRLRH
jgi:hypothetical protein